MDQEFLITKEYLCLNTPVDKNLKDNEVRNAMTDANLFDLLFLGIPLLDLFKAHLATQAPLTDVQEVLLGMVRYYNAYRVFYHLTFNAFKLANDGVTQAPGAVDFASWKEYRGQIDVKCATLKRQIMEYIQFNQAAIPQAAPEPAAPLADDPLDTLGVVWSPNVQRYFY